MLNKDQKERVIAKFATTKGDTGSTEVQVALLTAEIDDITKHLQKHKKDHSSRRGLLRKVGQRRRLLRYLAKDDVNSFKKLTKALGLKAKAYESLTQAEAEEVAAEKKAEEKAEKAEKEAKS